MIESILRRFLDGVDEKDRDAYQDENDNEQPAFSRHLDHRLIAISPLQKPSENVGRANDLLEINALAVSPSTTGRSAFAVSAKGKSRDAIAFYLPFQITFFICRCGRK